MIGYIDSSVLLRHIFNEKDPLKVFFDLDYAFSSKLLQIECLRSIDRYRILNRLQDSKYIEFLDAFHSLLEGIELIQLESSILTRASQPFPTLLGTLDAMHLATGLFYKESTHQDFCFLTHDIQLAQAARVMGFSVL